VDTADESYRLEKRKKRDKKKKKKRDRREREMVVERRVTRRRSKLVDEEPAQSYDEVGDEGECKEEMGREKEEEEEEEMEKEEEEAVHKKEPEENRRALRLEDVLGGSNRNHIYLKRQQETTENTLVTDSPQA